MATSIREAYTAVRQVGKFAKQFFVLEDALAGIADLDALREELSKAVASLTIERNTVQTAITTVKAEAERRASAAHLDAEHLVRDARIAADAVMRKANESAIQVADLAARKVMALDADIAELSKRAASLRAEGSALLAARDHLTSEIAALKDRLKPLVG